jgi:hypothetical protein
MLAPNRMTPWSSEDYAVLRQMLRKHYSTANIAKALGRSVEAVQDQARSLGLITKTWQRRKDVASQGPVDIKEDSCWRRECAIANERFCDAMEAAGYQRTAPHTILNAAGSTR